ncbi:hypothetical protein LEN26_010142 [Aphanomyces euteiches]|nr:hypothetical protein LEN26_010142 [Aphanomyces euteiches]
MSAEAENIRVAVRCRPMSEKELREQAESCFVCRNGNAVLTNPDNKDEVHEFGFDFVYGINTEQRVVFEDFGRPVLERAFGGYNGTIFAYGQTGSGKTFSMTGVNGNEVLEGLIPRMNKSLFEKIQTEKANDPNKLFLVECSFFEIYNEIIYDLLDSNPSKDKKNKGLEIKEHSVLGIYVKDLQERVVESREEVIELMSLGASNRTVGYTNMNAESSRSHSIFVIKIHQKDSSDESKNVFAKVNLVDLAGSERAAGTGAVGTRNVINALVEDARTGKKSFIPYRNSKLTRVLQESLGGNSLCSMLATLSPANINFIETLGTLKYASRAKSIKVNAKKNEEASQISQLNEEIAALKRKLMEQTESGLDPREKNEIVAKYEKQIQEIDAVRMQTWEDKAKLSKQHEMERKKLAKEKARADQKTQEEKIKKWKLLESKADIELAIRATRELEVGDDSWITMTTKAKSLEQDVKDARTLICVFKDSLDKDFGTWKTQQNDECDDASSSHTIASQICTKIKNIQEESAKLMALESELLRQTSFIIDVLCDESEKLTTVPPPATKEQKMLLEDREKALNITRTMVQTYRATLVTNLKTERKRILSFTDASALMLAELQSQIDSPSIDNDRKNARVIAKKSLAGAMEACSNLTISKSESSQKVLIPKGELHALGLEGRSISDERLSASSGEAKHARLNGANCWIAQADDTTPWLKVDIGSSKFIDSIHIQGGVIGGSSVLNDTPLLLIKSRMSELSKAYDPSAVTGDHQQTYDIAKNIMSWVGLLKTTQIPTKLFSRPPVRFIHDIITLVVTNTGFGQGVFTDKEKDYSQLAEKKDKSDYLTKVIQLVSSSFQGIVEVKATESNILAGKEPEQTMQCIALFCLGAIRHLASTLPDTDETPTTTQTPSVETQNAWVTELAIEFSVDGETWIKPENFSMNSSNDAYTVIPTKLPKPVTARYLKLFPIKWNVLPAFRCEIFGFSVGEKDDTISEVQDEGLQYLGLLTTLYSAGELILDEAKIKWKKARDIQREKQAELKSVLLEIDSWKSQVAGLKADLEISNKAVERWKSDKLEVDKQLTSTTSKLDTLIQTSKTQEEQLKKAKGSIESLTNQVNEASKEASSWKQQHGQLNEQLKSVAQSKVDLEKLIETLRNQLSSKSASEGVTDSKLATLSADLQSVTIQLDETKRAFQRSEKINADVQAERDGLAVELTKARAEISSRDAATDAMETKHKMELTASRSELAALQASLQESLNKQCETDEKFEKAIANANSLKNELDQTKKKDGDNHQAELKRLQEEAVESEKRIFQIQTEQIRLKADNERLEAKYSSVEEKVKSLESKLSESAQLTESLQKEKKQLLEQEEELQLQLQVVTEERDSARQKEEQLFIENAEKDQEIERIRDGYVWVTDRMNNKEDELAELQEQLEKYQSLLKLAGESTTHSRPSTGQPSNEQLFGLYRAAFDKEFVKDNQSTDASAQLMEWILVQKKAQTLVKPQEREKMAEKGSKAEQVPDESQPQSKASSNSTKVEDTPNSAQNNLQAKNTEQISEKSSTKQISSEDKGNSSKIAPETKEVDKKQISQEEYEKKKDDKKANDPGKHEVDKPVASANPTAPSKNVPVKEAKKDLNGDAINNTKDKANQIDKHNDSNSEQHSDKNGKKDAKAVKIEGSSPLATDVKNVTNEQPHVTTSTNGTSSASSNKPKETSKTNDPPSKPRRESIEDLTDDAEAPESPHIQNEDLSEAKEVCEEQENEYDDDDFDAYDEENPTSKRGKSKRRIVEKQPQSTSVNSASRKAPIEKSSTKS